MITYNDGRNNFKDFFLQYPKYSKYNDNPIAEKIFLLMNELQIISLMLAASEQDKPALSATVYDVEYLCKNQKVFDLSDDFTKQAVGAMIRTILDPFGYEPIKQKRLPKDSSIFFSSASVYKLNKAKQKIVLVQKLYIEKVEDTFDK
jgi:hypothetical protein